MVIYPFKLPEGKFFPCPLMILGRRYLGGSACLDQWPNGDSPQLLGGFSMFFATPLKKLKVKWFDKIPSIWENGKIKCMFQTSKPPTSQPYNDSLVSTPGVFCFNVCVVAVALAGSESQNQSHLCEILRKTSQEGRMISEWGAHQPCFPANVLEPSC
jgi:hypothetical protein